MKKCLVCFMILISTILLFSQESNDVEKIKNTSLDYIEGWYEGDVKRMERALHPELAKRMVFGVSGKSKLKDLSTDQMLKYTKNGGGKNVPAENRKIEVTVLDALSNTATVKISSVKYTDYAHLIKWNKKWVIINVVWENK